jgi:hypothetical protein
MVATGRDHEQGMKAVSVPNLRALISHSRLFSTLGLALMNRFAPRTFIEILIICENFL